jgi:hypothetical protein
MFSDEDFSPSTVTDSLLQGNKNLEMFGLLGSHTSNANSDACSQHTISGLNTGHSASESKLHHVIPVEIISSPKAEARRETPLFSNPPL